MIKQVINLSRNENLYGFPNRILQRNKLFDRMEFITYQRESKLRNKLSKQHKVEADNIFIEVGAEGALREIFVGLSRLPSCKLLLSDILWDYYKELAKQNQIDTAFYRIKENNEKNTYEFDLTDIYNSIREKKPAAIIINSPHNPAGHQMSRENLSRLLKNSDKKLIFILDETYFGFSKSYDDRGLLIKKYPNLVVIRSFSKFYAIAGLRIGYLLIGDYARQKLNIHTPYLGHNFIAEKIANLLLNETKFYESLREKINNCHDFLYTYFNNLRGFQAFKSSANFLLIRISPDLYSHTEYKKYLEENGFLIKLYTEDKLKNSIRITIPLKKDIRKIILLTNSFVAKKRNG